MDFENYLINLRYLFLNKNNCSINLIEKLIHQLKLERNYLTNTCYNYFDIKYLNKKEFSDIFLFVNTFNRFINKFINNGRDYRTLVKYKEHYILFEELYVPTMDCNIYIYNLELDLNSIEYDFIVSIEDIIDFYKIHIPEQISKDYYFKYISY